MGKIIVESASVAELLALVAGMGNASFTANNRAASQTDASDEDESGTVDSSAPSVDSTGMPWDERIHAESKARTANGVWRKRRNVSDELVKQVESERRAAAPVVPSTPVQPEVVMPIMPVAEAPAPIVHSVPPQMPANLPEFPTSAPAAPAMDFNTFILKVQGLMQTANPANGNQAYITTQTLTNLNGAMGIGNITELAANSARIPEAVQFFRNNAAWVD